MSAIDLALRPVVDERRLIASVAQVERWLATAGAGDVLHYATCGYLPLHEAGPRHLRSLSDRGLVYLTQKRSDLLAGEFCYLAQRSSRAVADAIVPEPAPERPRLALRVDESGDFHAGDLLLPLLIRAARHGRPCPTDKQLAQRAGIPVDFVQAGLTALRAARLIVVHAAPAPTLRRVTILETGAQTGWAV